MYKNLIAEIHDIPDYTITGTVSAVRGLIIECVGICRFVAIGSRCQVVKIDKKAILAEVISVNNRFICLMSYADNNGVAVGCKVKILAKQAIIHPDQSWLGRVINGLAVPLDDKGALIKGEDPYFLYNTPPPAHKRKIIDKKLDLGITAINTFITCAYGQRMGIFAGSGVGKSVLLGMIARFASSDVKVVGLIGERGREVQEFLQHYLGDSGLANTIVVVATSDESALMRKQATYLVLTIAEYFRDLGMDVLCMIDSITRFAIAQREIGLSAGEPPITKGYTTSVFTELPKLSERAGAGEKGVGSITGLFTVLVEGDDMEEPVADSMRAILDGHIVMDRKLAEQGQFPAINILRSISRTMINVVTPEEMALNKKARSIIATYAEMEEMIKLGIYKQGSNPEVDSAIKYHPILEQFLSQSPNEGSSLNKDYEKLAEILKTY